MQEALVYTEEKIKLVSNDPSKPKTRLRANRQMVFFKTWSQCFLTSLNLGCSCCSLGLAQAQCEKHSSMVSSEEVSGAQWCMRYPRKGCAREDVSGLTWSHGKSASLYLGDATILLFWSSTKKNYDLSFCPQYLITRLYILVRYSNKYVWKCDWSGKYLVQIEKETQETTRERKVQQ